MDKGTSILQKTGLILLGIFLSLVILEIGLRMAGGIYLYVQHSHDPALTLKHNEYRIMCVGESTTQMGGAFSYPFELQDALNKQSKKIKFIVINTGQSGVTSEDLLIKFEDNINKFKPQMVIVMMGINDHSDFNPLEKGGKAFYMEGSWFDSLRVCKLFKAVWINMISRIWDLSLSKKDEPRRQQAGAGHENGKLNVLSKSGKSNGSDKLYLSYCDSANKYAADQNFLKTQEMYQKAIALDPSRSMAYIGLGEFYRASDKVSPAVAAKTETMLVKAIQIEPKNVNLYLDLGSLNHSDDPGCLAMFQKALEIDPKSQRAYTGMTLYYLIHNNYAAAEKTITDAINKNIEDLPVPFWRYVGIVSERNKDYMKEEKAYRKIIEMQGATNMDFCNLAEFYKKHGDEKRAREIDEEAIKLNGGSRRVYQQLAAIYKDEGNNIFADICLKKSQMLGDLYQNQRTISNYRRLLTIARQHHIQIVGMSYATRAIGPLKKILGNPKDILFVDNENIFKKAVKNEGYGTIFIDKFAGDFGHCTARGNQIMVQNILKVLQQDGSFNSLLDN